MDTRDGEVQRLATQRVWSEDEGQCIVAAEWRVARGVRTGAGVAALTAGAGVGLRPNNIPQMPIWS